MKFRILQWIAILLILLTGYLHLITAPEEYGEAPYMGWLFFANFLGSLVSVVGIYRRKLWWGWVLGILITAGSILGYIQSRTFGMPGMHVEPWIHPIGIPAKIVEGLFLIVLVLARPWSVPVMNEEYLAFRSTAKRATTSRFFTPVLIFIMVFVAIGSYQLGARNSETSHGSEHPLPETVITTQALEEEYGIRMMLVAVTAAGGLVDVRYKVIDPEKAARLATEDGIMPMVYLENSDIMLMPDAHMRTQKLIPDRTYFTLIPNAGNAVSRGTSVIVVFGDIALESIITQ